MALGEDSSAEVNRHNKSVRLRDKQKGENSKEESDKTKR